MNIAAVNKLETFPKEILRSRVLCCKQCNLSTMIPPVTTLCTSIPGSNRSFTCSEQSIKKTSKDSEPVSPTNSGKRVCFADSIGLSLVSTRLISPCISEKRQLRRIGFSSRAVFVSQSNTALKFLSCEFPQPRDSATEFDDRLTAQHVCLERVICSNFALLGTVKVQNMAYEKKVTVRVSLDCWQTYQEIWADYVSTYPDNKADKFIFRISLPSYFDVGQKVAFAIRYLVRGQEFWDNNLTHNYIVRCLKVQASSDCGCAVPSYTRRPALLEL